MAVKKLCGRRRHNKRHVFRVPRKMDPELRRTKKVVETFLVCRSRFRLPRPMPQEEEIVKCVPLFVPSPLPETPSGDLICADPLDPAVTVRAGRFRQEVLSKRIGLTKLVAETLGRGEFSPSLDFFFLDCAYVAGLALREAGDVRHWPATSRPVVSAIDYKKARDGSRGKKFVLHASSAIMYNAMTRAKDGNHYYFCIHNDGRGCYPYVDIDLGGEVLRWFKAKVLGVDADDSHLPELLFNNFVRLFGNYLDSLGLSRLMDPARCFVLVANKHGAKGIIKISMHLVFRLFLLRCIQAVTHFFAAFFEFLDRVARTTGDEYAILFGLHGRVFDPKVYTKFVQFRGPGQTKLGENRPLFPPEYHQPSVDAYLTGKLYLFDPSNPIDDPDNTAAAPAVPEVEVLNPLGQRGLSGRDDLLQWGDHEGRLIDGVPGCKVFTSILSARKWANQHLSEMPDPALFMHQPCDPSSRAKGLGRVRFVVAESPDAWEDCDRKLVSAFGEEASAWHAVWDRWVFAVIDYEDKIVLPEGTSSTVKEAVLKAKRTKDLDHLQEAWRKYSNHKGRNWDRAKIRLGCSSGLTPDGDLIISFRLVDLGVLYATPGDMKADMESFVAFIVASDDIPGSGGEFDQCPYKSNSGHLRVTGSVKRQQPWRPLKPVLIADRSCPPREHVPTFRHHEYAATACVVSGLGRPRPGASATTSIDERVEVIAASRPFHVSETAEAQVITAEALSAFSSVYTEFKEDMIRILEAVGKRRDNFVDHARFFQTATTLLALGVPVAAIDKLRQENTVGMRNKCSARQYVGNVVMRNGVSAAVMLTKLLGGGKGSSKEAKQEVHALIGKRVMHRIYSSEEDKKGWTPTKLRDLPQERRREMTIECFDIGDGIVGVKKIVREEAVTAVLPGDVRRCFDRDKTRHGAVCVIAPMGAGKTEALICTIAEMSAPAAVPQFEICLVMCPGRALTMAQSERMRQQLNPQKIAVIDYLNDRAALLAHPPTGAVVLCSPQSLWRMQEYLRGLLANPDGPPIFLVLDEIEASLEHLHNPKTHKVGRFAANCALFRDLNQSPRARVLAMDALMSERTIAAMKALGRGVSLEVIEYQVPARIPRLVRIPHNPVSGPDQNILSVIVGLKKSYPAARIFIYCASCRFLHNRVISPIRLELPDIKLFVFSSREKTAELHVVELGGLKDYDFTLFSPSVTAGVSITNPPFSFSIFIAEPNGPTLAMQMQGSRRARDITSGLCFYALRPTKSFVLPYTLAWCKAKLNYEVKADDFVQCGGAVFPGNEPPAAVDDGDGEMNGEEQESEEVEGDETPADVAGGVDTSAQAGPRELHRAAATEPWLFDIVARSRQHYGMCSALPFEVSEHFLRKVGYRDVEEDAAMPDGELVSAFLSRVCGAPAVVLGETESAKQEARRWISESRYLAKTAWTEVHPCVCERRCPNEYYYSDREADLLEKSRNNPKAEPLTRKEEWILAIDRFYRMVDKNGETFTAMLDDAQRLVPSERLIDALVATMAEPDGQTLIRNIRAEKELGRLSRGDLVNILHRGAPTLSLQSRNRAINKALTIAEICNVLGLRSSFDTESRIPRAKVEELARWFAGKPRKDELAGVGEKLTRAAAVQQQFGTKNQSLQAWGADTLPDVKATLAFASSVFSSWSRVRGIMALRPRQVNSQKVFEYQVKNHEAAAAAAPAAATADSAGSGGAQEGESNPMTTLLNSIAGTLQSLLLPSCPPRNETFDETQED